MTFVWGILALGLLVFVHELGHFAAARFFGVTVEAFSIGMGPVLIHRKRKETDYRLSLIPLGGYCAMKGEQDFRTAIEQELTEIKADADSFYGIHPLKRLAIALAGPLANLAFGFLAFFIVALTGYSYYSAGTTVSMADELYPDIFSAAKSAGMKTGDEILSLNGVKMEDFSEIASYISARPQERIEAEVRRGNDILMISVVPELDKETGAGRIGIAADPNSVVKRSYPRHSIPGAFRERAVQSWRIIFLTAKGAAALFKGVNLANAVSGPVRITSMIGTAAQQGFSAGMREGIAATLQFLALISISLFLTNLLPVPVLDGGLILFALIEFLARRKLNPKLLYRIQIAGVFIIAALIAVSLAGDILYFLRK